MICFLCSWLLLNEIGQADEKIVACNIPFSDFLHEMKAVSVNRGIPLETVSKVLVNTNYLPEVINLDRDQKAFKTSFIEFSNKSINQYRLLNGEKKIKKYQTIFQSIWQKYGISPEVIIAFWAMETDYGAVQGNFHTLSALGTLANDCRRSELFQLQYLAAMKLVQNKTIDVLESYGAWAGEFGQVQMLPSDILAFGSDGDGDGRVKLDNSAQDTILTAAKLIASKGWEYQQPWFEEVTVTKEFPWSEAGLGRDRSIREWIKLGVTPRNEALVYKNVDIETTLILPQGLKGPKFLAYPNFNVFMKWNNSFIYSTTAAYLANRLKGDLEFLSDNPDDILNLSQMIQLQEILQRLGYDVGKIDGILGAKTRQSVRNLQITLGFPADSWPTSELLNFLKSIF